MTGSRPLAVSLIGAGDFARTTLLPLLRSHRVALRGIVDRNPASASVAAARFGAKFSSTDPDAVLTDARTEAVFISTYHDSHAPLTVSALAQGKMIFVEKPPVVSHSQLTDLVEAWKNHPGFVCVGYNRRFAPAVREVMPLLRQEKGPVTVTCIVREIEIPHTHWYYWPKEGTRILGNMCHWVDLAYFLTGRATPHQVAGLTAPRGRFDDNCSATISFADGSMATIIFSGRGDQMQGAQEFIEIRRGGLTAQIHDFHELRVLRDGRWRRHWRGFRDKGHTREIEKVVRAMRDGKPTPIKFSELVTTSRITLAIREALENSAIVNVNQGTEVS